MVNSSKVRDKDRDRDRPTILVFQDNKVPRDNGVLLEGMRMVESTLLSVVTTKDGLRRTVRLYTRHRGGRIS
jgi:hypothetical protein